MKFFFLFVIVLILCTPVSSAKQPAGYNDTAVKGDIVELLLCIEQNLNSKQSDKLSSTWTETEDKWNLLFELSSTPQLNKIYNQLQVSYLLFQKQKKIEAFRRDLHVAVNFLTNELLPS